MSGTALIAPRKGCSVSLPEPFTPLPPATGSAPVASQMPVKAAIARAAAATGVDFNYLLAQARLESGLDPQARARTSSARGLYQFTGSTWMKTLDRHGADFGLDTTGASSDPATRAQWLALRQNPQVSALMAGELANDNRAYLYGVLGRDPDNSELYLAHFLGPDAAGKFLSALSSDPSQSAAALLPKAAGANHAIFFSGSTPRSVGEVMDLLRNRLDTAMAGSGAGGRLSGDAALAAFGATGIGGSVLPLAATSATTTPTGGPIAREFAAAAAAAGPAGGRSSMADTLQATFGMTETADATVPANVRAAYGRMRALGL